MRHPADEALNLCAEAEYRFADLALGTLGHRPHSNGSLWWATAAVPPVFVQAGSLQRHGLDKAVDALSAVPGRALFRDTFSALDLTAHGFGADTSETWMVRAAKTLDTPAVAGLAIRRAVTPGGVALFERTAYSNAGELGSYVRGAVHPASATATVTHLHLLVGYREGDPVATAIGVSGPRVTGIQAVTTHPAFRRRGIGAAMVAACCAVSPGLPTALSSRPGAVRLYRSLGFSDLGAATQWARRIT